MIGLTSSSQVAITSMNNFPCLLMFNFQYTAFFFNIFDREVMSVLDKISTCFLFFLNLAESHTFISAWFYQPVIISLLVTVAGVIFLKKVKVKVLSQGSVCTLYDGGKPL